VTNIKVYLAILNNGWLRREISATVLPQMKATPGVELVWEHPAKTWDHPISSNRNQIVRRFLQTDCDFLLMLDNDVVPLSNPLELVFASKDIVGMPAKVRQRNRSVNWVAYVKNPHVEQGYAPVDFSRVDTDVDLLKVDAIGTGCILIKRRVLEAIPAPFHCIYDEHGVCIMGTDFAFCQRADQAGFEIYTTPQRTCEHFKEVGLADILSWDDSDGRDALPESIQLPSTGFEITQGDWRFIRGIIEKHQVATVLEFGAGLSSKLMAQIARVVSYETDEQYAQKIAGANGNPEIRIWDGKNLDLDERFDLVFVDGPAGSGVGGSGREHSMRIAAKCADRIIVHDAARKHEAHWQRVYLKPEFKLIAKSGHHETRCNYWERRK